MKNRNLVVGALAIFILNNFLTAQPDLLQGLVTSQNSATVAAVGPLIVGQPFTDPFFNVKIFRLSNAAGTPGLVCKPPYSPTPAWNADESLLMVWHRNPWAYVFYDGKTYTEFRRVTRINPNDVEMLWWHPTNPDRLFFPEGNILKMYSYSADAVTNYHVFSQYTSLSNDGHNYPFSWDGNYFGYSATLTGGGVQWFVFDMQQKKMVGAYAQGNAETPVLAPSGKYFVAGNKVYDALTATLARQLSFDVSEHNDIGLWQGEDYLVRANFDDNPTGIASYKLSDGSVRSLIPGYYPPTATHISCKNFQAQGWCIVSSIGSDAIGGPVRAFHKEIYIAKLDGSGTFGRVCHHRSSEDIIEYWAEPHVVFSPSGTRACFGSDWENKGYVDAFAVEFPSYHPNSRVNRPANDNGKPKFDFNVQNRAGSHRIRYNLPVGKQLRIEIFDSNGNLLQTLVAAGAGQRTVVCTPVASGVYYYRLMTEKRQLTKKAVAMK